MRKNLGRILVVLTLLFNIQLLATTYKWSAYSSKKEAYVNEAIYLKYVCEFSDRGELYTIDFNPVIDNEKYTVELFSQHTKIVDGKRVNSYEYIAFVKEPMEMKFEFDVLMKKTTQDSIENTVLGRDNVENEEFLIRAIKQESIKVQIKRTNSDFVGDFSLSVEADEANVKAYEPYHLNVIIKGSGNLQALKPIEFKIDGVKLFTEKPIKKIELTKDGYVGVWNQKFAFVGDNDFKIPALKIEYFDIKDKSLQELNIEAIKVKVAPAFKAAELLDEEVNSTPFSLDFIYYILTFIAGFLVAKVKLKKRTLNAKDETFMQKVKSTETLHELSMLLVLKDNKMFNKLVLDIELKKVISLEKAKKSVEMLIK